MLSVGQAQTLSTVSTPNDTDDYKTVNVGAGDYGVWVSDLWCLGVRLGSWFPARSAP